MIQLILFGTSACHLCEQAEVILQDLTVNGAALQLDKIDIAEHPQWQPQYAIRIPVLLHPSTQQELGWPFDHAQVHAFLKALTDD
ncbi:glutaredoxin family protein [Methylosoma difficile]